MKHLEIKQMRYFCTAATTLSLNSAARKIGITQPALTRQIQLLENDIGLELFRRKSTGLELTPHGRAFYDKAQGFISEYSRCIQSPKAAQRALNGQIILGSETDLFATWPSFAENIKGFQESHPKYNVTLADMESSGFECLIVKKIDVLVTMRQGFHIDERLQHISVGDATASVVVRNDHPLATEASIPFRKLSNEPLMLLNEKAYQGHIPDIKAICEEQGIPLNITHTATNPQTLLSFVAAGTGTLLTVGNLFDFNNSKLVKVPISDLKVNVPRMLSLIYRTGDENPALSPFLKSF